MTQPEPTLLTGRALEVANEVYSSIHFQHSDAQHDRTFGMLVAGRPVALGRIQRHAGGELELGGFWVQEERRGSGLARRLVLHVLAALPAGQAAWCLAFEHLEGFYRSFDMQPFEASAASAVPGVIREKLAFCEEQRARGRYHPVRLLLYVRPE